MPAPDLAESTTLDASVRPRTADTQAVLEVEHLEFRHREQASPALALDRLVLGRGERLFVHGPSGSGKSTLMSLLAGVRIADRGRIALLGHDWREVGAGSRDRRRGDHVGYVFQQFNLLGWLTVLENVCLPCRFSARRATQAARRSGSIEDDARQWLDALAIRPEYWSRPAATLSVGEQQRVAAARALIGEPELLLADEPSSALDSDRRDAFMTMLLDACTQSGSALVFVSHDRSLRGHFERSLALGGQTS